MTPRLVVTSERHARVGLGRRVLGHVCVCGRGWAWRGAETLKIVLCGGNDSWGEREGEGGRDIETRVARSVT